MVLHSELTVTAIHGHDNGATAVPALIESVSQLPGSRGLLISLERPQTLPDHIMWKQTAPLDYYQYSIFCMYALQTFVETEYCLLVQSDGWVIDGTNFTGKYYEYDYVGAPTHLGLYEDHFYPSFSWSKTKNALPVLNGGFSLRSRKLMQACTKHGIVHRAVNQAPFFNEDVQLTGLLRKELEKVGVRFSPLNIAKQFAVEYLAPNVHDDLDLAGLVGHHGPTRRLVSHKKIRIKHLPSQAKDIYGEVEFLVFLQNRGYEIEYSPVQT